MRALILLALCVAAWAATPSDSPSAASSDLEMELRGLKQDIMGFNTVRDKPTEAYRVISKASALVSKMTAGSHKTAANELLARSARKASLRAKVDCAEATKDFKEVLVLLGTAATSTGDCTIDGFSEMVAQVGQMAPSPIPDAATAAAFKRKVSKECSVTGAASDTSCGATGPVAVLSKISRQYGSAPGVNSCPEIGVGNTTLRVSDVLIVGMYADSICLKDADVFCMPKIFEGGGFNLQMNGPPTTESLDSMCSPCTLKVLQAQMRLMMMMFMAIGDSGGAGEKKSKDEDQVMATLLEAMFGMFCSKNLAGDQYCMLDAGIQMMMAPSDETKDDDMGVSGPDAVNAKSVCSHCGMKMMHTAMKIVPAAEAEGIMKQITAGCFKQGEKFCLEFIQDGNWEKAMTDCGAPEDPGVRPLPAGDTCSEACKLTFKTITKEWGCCLAMMAAAESTEFLTYLEKQAGSCDAKVATKCSGGKPAKFGIKVSNLANTWFETSATNKKMVNDLVGGDVSSAFGLPASLVTTKGEKMSNGGTRVSINMEFQTADDATKVRAAFKAMAKNRRAGVALSFESLELLPADAKVDPTATMSVEIEDEIEDGTSVMGADMLIGLSSDVAPSLIVAVLGALVALVF